MRWALLLELLSALLWVTRSVSRLGLPSVTQSGMPREPMLAQTLVPQWAMRWVLLLELLSALLWVRQWASRLVQQWVTQ
jgi:hypothetical protein